MAGVLTGNNTNRKDGGCELGPICYHAAVGGEIRGEV